MVASLGVAVILLPSVHASPEAVGNPVMSGNVLPSSIGTGGWGIRSRNDRNPDECTIGPACDAIAGNGIDANVGIAF